MAVWVDLLRMFSVLNTVFLGLLSYVWVRNYLQFRSKHTLGLAAFAAILLVQNVVTAYVFTIHDTLTPWIAAQAPIAQSTMMALKGLEFGALLVLTYTTWD